MALRQFKFSKAKRYYNRIQMAKDDYTKDLNLFESMRDFVNQYISTKSNLDELIEDHKVVLEKISNYNQLEK